MKSITSTVLEDNDRKPMARSSTAIHAGVEVRMKEALFEAKNNCFSLGESLLATVGAHPDVPPQSTAAYNEVGMRTEAMLQLVDSLGSLSLVWLSLLATPGLLIWHKEGGPVVEQLRYVVGSSSAGALVAHVLPFRAHGRKWVDPRPHVRLRVSQHVICNLGGWM